MKRTHHYEGFTGERPQYAWDVKQVARYLRLAEETVYKGKAETWKIPRIKQGRLIRFDPDDVMSFVEGCKVFVNETDDREADHTKPVETPAIEADQRANSNWGNEPVYAPSAVGAPDGIPPEADDDHKRRGPQPRHHSGELWENSVTSCLDILIARRESAAPQQEDITVEDFAGEMQPPLRRSTWHRHARVARKPDGTVGIRKKEVLAEAHRRFREKNLED